MCNFFAPLNSEIESFNAVELASETNSSQMAYVAGTGVLTVGYGTPLQWEWQTSFLSVTIHAHS